MLIFASLGTLNIREVDRARSASSTTGSILAISLLIFAGAMGKSAQFPLHVWLPDAMEGPTPVSALIHAATMVNAGVYLVARTNPIFAHAQEALVIVAAIGIFTAILAASIAMTQTDIKRVLAYSTLSQLGYMFAALGVGRLHGGDLPPDDPRLLQGPAVPRLGIGDPRRPRGAGHAPDGRALEEDPDHLRDDARSARSRSPAFRRWPASSPRTRSSARRSSSASRGSGRSACSSRCMTAFYMFRLMGLTFWGEFRGAARDLGPDPRVAAR